jgi:2-keto-3-deoxy-L-rhamnonate aldolase RhmA
MSTETIADIAIAARAAELSTLVHPSTEYKGTYGPFLEAGVWGLSLDIDSVAEAQQVVHGTRHAPMGNRGTFEPGPQNDYQEDPQDLAALNDEIHVTARIGSVQGCLIASDIMAIHGIDAVEVDRRRLSKALADDAAELDRLEASVHGAAARHGKVISAPACDEGELRRLAELGVQMLRYRSDAEILADGFARVVSHCVRAKEP